jgi:hypothetical protein
MGTPPDLQIHYQNYPYSLNANSFTAKVNLIEGTAVKAFPHQLNLFGSNSNFVPPPLADQGNPNKAQTDSESVTEWNRYLTWELNSPDFQHSIYPTLALKKSMELTSAFSKQQAVNAEAYQVNQPYTPKISSFSVDYTASAELNIPATDENPSEIRFFHIQPFGFARLTHYDVLPGYSWSGYPLLPQYDFAGELYIGLRNVAAPQPLTLLFQVAEGTADPELPPQTLHWSYLSDNHWLPLKAGDGILSDSTLGLVNSGIVELELKPAQPNTLLPDDLYWIRISIEKAVSSVCDIVAIHTNALLTTFFDQQNAEDHLSSGLPPESISEPVTSIPGIAALKQPYSSFGGKSQEQDQNFYIRVSERLRHKGRALTAWDYEHLILEHFPNIYKAKCLDADPNNPGKIQIVVIPDIKKRRPFNPSAPKVAADQIRKIQSFLQKKAPPFIGIEVKNARYTPVKIHCGVRFVPGKDEGFYRPQLNEELKRFLSPWAYEEGADLVIGGSIYANSIINFIDSRDYVDYVATFSFLLGEQEELVTKNAEGHYYVRAREPDEVLVSAQEHLFQPIRTTDFRMEEFVGINFMRTELDFIVA